MPERPESISFGIIADIQYYDGPPVKERFYRNGPEKLKIALDTFEKHRLDFIINLGDMIDRDRDSFDRILPLVAHLPIQHVLGNHDYEVANQYKAKIHSIIGTEKYYAFLVGNWRFVVLDGNEISTFANLSGSHHHELAKQWLAEGGQKQKPNANFWNGGIGPDQLAWLEQILQNASVSNEKVIVFCHYPIYPVDRHNLLNDGELLDLVGKYDVVKAWINGHNHDGNYGQVHNTHFINMKGMVETEHETPFAIAILSDGFISIIGYGPERSFKLTI